jgi:hypothetical protein
MIAAKLEDGVCRRNSVSKGTATAKLLTRTPAMRERVNELRNLRWP